jgi:hypothetical protein
MRRRGTLVVLDAHGGRVGWVARLAQQFAVPSSASSVWNLLPLAGFWFLPSVVGLPLLIRALRRHVGRSSALSSAWIRTRA